MLQMNVKDVVTTFAPIMLGRTWRTGPDHPSQERRAAFFCFDISIHTLPYDDGPDVGERHFVWILVTQDHKVFYQITDGARIDNLENFKLTSQHDSCWRSDGLRFLTDFYFDVCKRIAPTKAPKELNASVYFSVFSEPKVVNVELERIPIPDQEEWKVKEVMFLNGSYLTPRKAAK